MSRWIEQRSIAHVVFLFDIQDHKELFDHLSKNSYAVPLTVVSLLLFFSFLVCFSFCRTTKSNDFGSLCKTNHLVGHVVGFALCFGFLSLPILFLFVCLWHVSLTITVDVVSWSVNCCQTGSARSGQCWIFPSRLRTQRSRRRTWASLPTTCAWR